MKVKNVSGVDLIVPALGGRLVMSGAVVDVPDELGENMTEQAPNWAAVGETAPKKKENN